MLLFFGALASFHITSPDRSPFQKSRSSRDSPMKSKRSLLRNRHRPEPHNRSSCYWNAKDDGPEREICRVLSKYEGIWAAGTMFHYPCAKSSTQSFSHPLQYEIRYMQDIEFPEGRTRRGVVLREKPPVAACR